MSANVSEAVTPLMVDTIGGSMKSSNKHLIYYLKERMEKYEIRRNLQGCFREWQC